MSSPTPCLSLLSWGAGVTFPRTAGCPFGEHFPGFRGLSPALVALCSVGRLCTGTGASPLHRGPGSRAPLLSRGYRRGHRKTVGAPTSCQGNSPGGRGAVGATLAPQGASAPGRGRHEHHTVVLLTVWAGEASKNQGGTSLKVGGSWEVLPGRKTPDSGRKQGALETSGSPPGSETVFLRTPRTLTLQESRMAPVLRKAARKSVSPQASFPLPGRPRRCPRPPPQPAPWRQERQLQAVPRPLRDTSRSPELANSGHKSPANRIMRFNI